MSKRQLFAALALVLFLSIFPWQRAKADAGPPPPSMTFYFQTDGGTPNITDIALRVCETPTCEQFTLFPPPEEEHEPWEKIWLTCKDGHCLAAGMPSRKYYQLVVQLNGQRLLSNVFTQKSYSAKYHVMVQGGALQVEEIPLSDYTFFEFVDPWLFFLFWLALAWTLGVEALVWVAADARGWRKIKANHVLIVNLISLPVIWLVMPLLVFDVRLAFAAGEAFAFLFEGGAYFILNRAARISVKEAFAFSAIANLTSLLTALGAVGALALLFTHPAAFLVLLLLLLAACGTWVFISARRQYKRHR